MTSSPNPPADNHADIGDPAAGISVIDCLRLGTQQLQSLHGIKHPAASSAQSPASKDTQAICRLEAEVLLAFVLGKNHSWLYAWPEQTVTSSEAVQYRQLLTERCSGKPVAYLTGYQEFWSMNFQVSPDVLIPRPDTELLVELSIDYLSTEQEPATTDATQTNTPDRILELGTGSGAVAIALASELDNTEITATDISSQALQIARNNAKRLLDKRACRITFVESDWFQQLSPAGSATNSAGNDVKISSKSGYQLIVSNPPYIRPDDPHLSKTLTGISFEPRSALVAEDKGLQSLQKIIQGALPFLAGGAMLALEHGHDQAQAVQQLLQHAGYLSIESHRDLAGVERVTFGHRPGVKF